jgi:hypothetical protein
LRVVEAVDEVADGVNGRLFGGPSSPVEQLLLEGLEEALDEPIGNSNPPREL